jgi:GNAT superfamily N-acetyltransferase
MVTTSQVMLGKLPTRIDPRTLSLARYLDRELLPAPPPELDLSERVISWPMYANDRIGDCTTAAAAHMVEAWTAAATGDAALVPESAVLAAFDAVKIVDPETGEEGAVELDVLKLWRSTGIGGHRIGAFARVARDDRDLVTTGAWLFGGLYVGLQLPLRAADQDVWDWSGRLDGPDAPGSWGGHAVDVVGYDEGGLTVVTWGALKRMTWAFWNRYGDEAWCVLSPDYLADGRSPQGFDLEALQHDLVLVTAGVA